MRRCFQTLLKFCLFCHMFVMPYISYWYNDSLFHRILEYQNGRTVIQHVMSPTISDFYGIIYWKPNLQIYRRTITLICYFLRRAYYYLNWCSTYNNIWDSDIFRNDIILLKCQLTKVHIASIAINWKLEPVISTLLRSENKTSLFTWGYKLQYVFEYDFCA